MGLHLGLSGLGLGPNSAGISTGPIRSTSPSVSPGDARQGTLETATAGTYAARGGGSVSITLQEWLRNGTQVATGLTYTPVLADVGATLIFREVATETGGTAPGTTATSVSVGTVIDIAPTTVGSLSNLTFQRNTGDQTIAAATVAAVFSGENRVYSVSGGVGVSINPTTGEITILDDTVQSAAITVTVTNSGGSTNDAFALTIDDVPGQQAAPDSVTPTGATSLIVDKAEKPTDNNSAITQYDLRYSADQLSWTEVLDVTDPITIDVGVADQLTYVQTRAVNGRGPGAWSLSTTGTTNTVAAPVWTTQPTLDQATYASGETVTRTEGVAANGTIALSLEYFRLNGVDKSGELSGLTWDSSGESSGNITYRMRATNESGFTLSNEVTATLEALALNLVGTNEIEIDGITGDISVTVTTPAEFAGTYTTDTASATLNTALTDAGPANLVLPSVTGSTGLGDTLTCDPGLWLYDGDNAAPATTYQWQSDGVNIGGATSATFDITASEQGTDVTCEVTQTGTNGARTAESAATSIPAAGTAPDAFTAGQWTLTDLQTNGDLRINISALPADNGSALTDLQYRVDSGTWTTLGGTTTGNYDPAGLAGLTDGQSYAVELRAVNSVGAGSASDTKNATPTGVPTAFTSGQWTSAQGSGTGEIDINILVVPSDGGSTITALQYSVDSGTTWAALTGTGTGVRTIDQHSDGTTGTLTASTSYNMMVRAVNAVGNAANSDTKATTSGAGDVTAPVLSSPTDTANGATASTGTVSTDEGNGTLYWVVTTSSTTPSGAQIRAGQDHTGTAASADGSQAVSGTGVQNIAPSGLTASTAYFTHYTQQDTAGNNATAVSASGFTTTAAASDPTSIMGADSDQWWSANLGGMFQDGGTTAAAVGDPVDLVPDQEGGADLRSDGSTGRPTLRNDGTNDYLEFDDSYLQRSFTRTGTTYCVMALSVEGLNGGTGNLERLLAYSLNTASNWWASAKFYASYNTFVGGGALQAQHSNGGESSVPVIIQGTGTVVVLEFWSNGTELGMSVNGGTDNTQTATGEPAQTDFLTIAAEPDLDLFIDLNVYCQATIGAMPSASERSDLRAWAAGESGVSL